MKSDIEKYKITLTGRMPLIMKADSVAWSDKMTEYRKKTPETKKDPKGDDRYPGFTWLGCLYHDGKHIVVPSDNLMACSKEGGTQVAAGGKKTFKSQTQSGAMVEGQSWPLLIKGKPIPVKELLALETETDFNEHQRVAKKLGFTLFVKRVVIGKSKHVRVRPMFENWSTTGILQVWDPSMDLETLKIIWSAAGRLKGLMEWRPGSKSPGVFGTFEATVVRG